MSRTLKLLLEEFGTETVIARILEQLMLLAKCDDPKVKEIVVNLVNECGCDTEYIYALCVFTNAITYADANPVVSDKPWLEESLRPLVTGFSKEFSY